MIASLFRRAKPKKIVVFMLGGPGTGKGTQSLLIQEHFKFKHLSAGDLLRQQRKSGSENGELIQSNIREGKIVPSYITVKLLDKAIDSHSQEYTKFLVDGFPRNLENLSNWLKEMSDKTVTPAVIALRGSQEVMIGRLLERGKISGRSDDNIESIKKRLVTNKVETEQTLNYFKKLDKLIEINADKSIEQVFGEIKNQFQKFNLQ